jgi:hypothetical protein
VSASKSFSYIYPCHASPHILCWSTFLIIFLVRQIFCLANHISVILSSRSCGSISCRFVYQLSYSLCYLGHFMCHLGLLYSFSENSVCFLSLLDQQHSFVIIIYLIITLYHSTTCHLWYCITLFHYLPFAVVHRIISFLVHVICCSDLYHLFGLTRRPGLHSMTTLKS